MAIESWPVKKPDGTRWGSVTKLIIDAHTREISHADVLVDSRHCVVRIAWRHFEVLNEAIMLRCENPPIIAVLPVRQPAAVTEPTRLEVAASQPMQ
jgi:hypothetical protein